MIYLKNIRAAHGKSQKEIAEITGMSQQYISFLETGERGKKLPVQTAKKLAAALGIDWQEFYKEEQNETQDRT